MANQIHSWEYHHPPGRQKIAGESKSVDLNEGGRLENQRFSMIGVLIRFTKKKQGYLYYMIFIFLVTPNRMTFRI